MLVGTVGVICRNIQTSQKDEKGVCLNRLAPIAAGTPQKTNIRCPIGNRKGCYPPGKAAHVHVAARNSVVKSITPHTKSLGAGARKSNRWSSAGPMGTGAAAPGGNLRTVRTLRLKGLSALYYSDELVACGIPLPVFEISRIWRSGRRILSSLFRGVWGCGKNAGVSQLNIARISSIIPITWRTVPGSTSTSS